MTSHGGMKSLISWQNQGLTREAPSCVLGGQTASIKLVSQNCTRKGGRQLPKGANLML